MTPVATGDAEMLAAIDLVRAGIRLDPQTATVEDRKTFEDQCALAFARRDDADRECLVLALACLGSYLAWQIDKGRRDLFLAMLAAEVEALAT